jgi:hypothetical protein
LKVVAFIDSPGHTVDVPQNVVDHTAQLVAKMMENVTLHGRLDAVGNISKKALTTKACVFNYLKDSTSTVGPKNTLASTHAGPARTPNARKWSLSGALSLSCRYTLL